MSVWCVWDHQSTRIPDSVWWLCLRSGVWCKIVVLDTLKFIVDSLTVPSLARSSAFSFPRLYISTPRWKQGDSLYRGETVRPYDDVCVGIGWKIFASFDDGCELCLINSSIIRKLERSFVKIGVIIVDDDDIASPATRVCDWTVCVAGDRLTGDVVNGVL